ncbi:MAG: hypothetical protein ACREE0_19385 [Phenylobacterium sp.]
MHAVISAGAGFLIAVLWFDLMFDVQARRGGATAPPEALASISAYYRRVTTEAGAMSRLVSAAMLLVVAAIVIEIVRGTDAWWTGWGSLAAAVGAIGLAGARIVPNAKRLGRGEDPPEIQTRLARSVLREHLVCLAAMAVVLTLQLLAELA